MRAHLQTTKYKRKFYEKNLEGKLACSFSSYEHFISTQFHLGYHNPVLRHIRAGLAYTQGKNKEI